MSKLICKLFGHKTSEEYNESGFPICLRCGSHSYHNSIEWGFPLYLQPIKWMEVKALELKRYFRKPATEDDLPF